MPNIANSLLGHTKELPRFQLFVKDAPTYYEIDLQPGPWEYGRFEMRELDQAQQM